MGDGRGAYGVLVGRTDGQRPLDRPRHRCDDNITMDLQDVGWRGLDWIDLAQNRDGWQAVVNAEMKIRLPLYAGKFLTSRGPVGFSERTLLYEVSK